MANDHDSQPPEDETSQSDLIVWGLNEPSEVEDAEVREARAELADVLMTRPHPRAMLDTIGFWVRQVAALLFAHVQLENLSVLNARKTDDIERVVYVMQTRSLLDFLYFNWVFLRESLPIAKFSNGIKTTWFRGFFTGLYAWVTPIRSEPDEEQMQALITHGESVFLFLEKPKAKRDENIDYSQRYLYRLIRAQRKLEVAIRVVPMLLVWERRPDAKHTTIVEEIFGTVQSPGFFRKFLHWFRTIWQSFLKFGKPIAHISDPIDLKNYLNEFPDADTADASELLRARLLETIASERQVILGPPPETPNDLWRSISTRPQLVEKVNEVAALEGVSEQSVLDRAKNQFAEIAAEPSLLTLKILSAVLSLIWYRIYDGFEIDQEGLERVREVAKDSSIVLIPSHKSHIDYLVISYLFYHYGMNNPLIAAGANLNFWPLGGIFRRAGAFFIRRTFKGDPLYPVVFREYLTKIMEEGFPIEFFIEGTRSRTGKLIKPKYGMLEMIVHAFSTGRVNAIKLVPISVAYERIIEEGAFRSENLGKSKEKESLGGLLKTPQFLTSKYGRLYVEFNEPIDLATYLEKYEIDLDLKMMDDEAVKALVVRLGHRIIYDINEVTTVTPTSLAAMVLLGNDAHGIDRSHFLRETGFLLRFLMEPKRNARLSRTLRENLASRGGSESSSLSTERDFALEAILGESVSDLMDWSIKLFSKSKQLSVEPIEASERYVVVEDARLELAYYRNTIVHHFVPEGLLACAIAKFDATEIPLDELMKETLFLSRLFKHEWIYEERAMFEEVFFRTLRYFRSSGWVDADLERLNVDADLTDAIVRVENPRPAELRFFRKQIAPFLETYAFVVQELETIDRPIMRDDLVKRTIKKAKAEYLNGGILFLESLSKPTYVNVLRLLVDWGVLQSRPEKKSVELSLSEQYSDSREREVLSKRLQAFLFVTAKTEQIDGRIETDVLDLI